MMVRFFKKTFNDGTEEAPFLECDMQEIPAAEDEIVFDDKGKEKFRLFDRTWDLSNPYSPTVNITVTSYQPPILEILNWDKDKKIQAIKAIREVTGMGLKEAKDLVEGAASNKINIKELRVSTEQVGQILRDGCVTWRFL